ncbi:MAG: hypothetical protein M9894_17735 [Planctomycetes bacterium]|nr:hypothetical protein [Planctomycetota bacterium]
MPGAATYSKQGMKTGRSHQIRLIRTTYVHIECKDPDGVTSFADYPYILELPDGEVIRDRLDQDGVCHHDGVLPGECKFWLVFDEDPPPAPPRTHTIKLRLEDEDGTPFAGCRYELVIGPETFKGRTNDKGVIVHEVPEEAEQGELHFWVEDDPDAEEMVWPLRVRDHLA